MLLVAPVCLDAPLAEERGLSIPPAPSFLGAELQSTSEGHATLSWTLPAESGPEGTELRFELEQSNDPAFTNHRLRYEGPGRSVFVSGLLEGRTYYRVRSRSSGAVPGPWSDPLVVEVSYPGRGQVLLLLAVGCVVFVCTAAAIVTGRLRYRPRSPAGKRVDG
jgi:hypothetical protein